MFSALLLKALRRVSNEQILSDPPLSSFKIKYYPSQHLILQQQPTVSQKLQIDNFTNVQYNNKSGLLITFVCSIKDSCFYINNFEFSLTSLIAGDTEGVQSVRPAEAG